MRETYSVACQSPGCRFARVYLRSRRAAEELARKHAEGERHQVEISRETIETVATIRGQRERVS